MPVWHCAATKALSHTGFLYCLHHCHRWQGIIVHYCGVSGDPIHIFGGSNRAITY